MKFRLINIATGLTLGQHNQRHGVNIYTSGGLAHSDDFRKVAISAIIRHDGAIGFQRHKPWYDEGELYFLSRAEWRVDVVVPVVKEL